MVRDREAQAEEVFKRREAEREKKLDEDKCLVQRATRVTCLEDVKIFETTKNLLHITFFFCIQLYSYNVPGSLPRTLADSLKSGFNV